MVEETCWCGVQKVAICVRCTKPACAAHYYIAVWYRTGPDHGWEAQGPVQNYALTIERFHGNTYAEAYAAGGPACTTCRTRAGEQAVQAVADQVSQFVEIGDPSGLEFIATHVDALTDDDKRQIGQYLYQLLGASMEVVRVKFAPGPLVMKGRFKKHPDASGVVAVTEEQRAPVAWMGRLRLAFTKGGTILQGKENHILSAAQVVVLPGTQITARLVHPPYDGAWGQPDRPQPSLYEIEQGTVVEPPQVMYGQEVALPDVLRAISTELSRTRR
jgi:hypothetical protein